MLVTPLTLTEHDGSALDAPLRSLLASRCLRLLVLGPLVLLALLGLVWVNTPAPLPPYQLILNQQQVSALSVHMNEALRVCLRPLERARGPVAVTAFLRGAAGVSRWTPTAHVTPGGTVLFNAVPALPPGTHELLFVLRRDGWLGRLADAVQPSGRRTLRALVHVLL